MSLRHTSTVLRAEPEIAARVGYFFAEFAALEWEMDAAFGAVLAIHEPVKDLFFRDRDGATQKVNVIRRVVEELAPASEVALTLKSQKAELEAVVTFRNSLAHGIYGAFGRDLRLTTPDHKRQYPLTVQEMDKWLDRLEAVADEFNFARKREWAKRGS
ncbi:hypothetical protein [Phenylobacterium sp.]|uniref:hypothetical protein n=1 Tax=Phenylobacterium sp. TaxID=1871053 RepID=UPI003D2A385C